MRRLILIVVLCLLSVGFAPPKAVLVSRCADFTALYNGEVESRPLAYEHFMDMQGVPAYPLEEPPVLDSQRFWVFEGLQGDEDPEQKGIVFGAVATVETENEPSYILVGMLNPDLPTPYLLIFDYHDPENVTLCDAFIITEKDALIMTVLTR